MSEIFWGTFVGALVGIIAGALIQYVSQRLFVRWQATNLLDALKKELTYDEIIIDNMQHQARRLTAAIGAGSLPTYYEIFRLGDVFLVMANKCFADGLLYGALSVDDLSKLQRAASFFTPATAQWVNDQVTEIKLGKGDPIGFATYLENELKDNKQRLKEVSNALKRVRMTFWAGPKPT